MDMETHITRIISISPLTHDVLQIRIEKPGGYSFTPGQATEVAINKPGWNTENRPFTFTNLPSDDYLEFIIKTYPSRNGVTNELRKLVPGDELIIHDTWGAIHYKGPGLFIAGGAGITPFISIFRYLQAENKFQNNRLLFANKKKNDVILGADLEKYFGAELINILSGESITGYRSGFITKQLLEEFIPASCDNFYVCGPPPMMDSVMQSLKEIGVSEKSLIIEM